MGVACLKSNVRNFRDVVTALCKKMSITNSVDPNETLHNAASHQVQRTLLR